MRLPESITRSSLFEGMTKPRQFHLFAVVRHWHRAAGVFVAIFLLVLSITGVLLLNTDALRLADKYVSNESLLDWYGIHPPGPIITYAAGDHWISQVGGRTYINDRALANFDLPPLGAVSYHAAELGELLVVATTQSLILLTPQGEVVETLGEVDGLPVPLRGVGNDREDGIVLAGKSHNFDFDLQHVSFTPRADAHLIRWSSTAPPPAELEQRLHQSYRGSGLSLEKVVLDLHSGHLFGRTGVILVTAASILSIFLAASGLYMWFKTSRRLHRRK